MKSKMNMTAADWDKFYGEVPEAPLDRVLLYRNKVLPHVVGEPRRILDVGCGTGDGLLEMHEAFPKALLYGLDYSEKAIESCCHRIPIGGMFHRFDITQPEPLPFHAELVMCVQTLEHFPAYQTAWVISKLFQATTKQLIISVPYANRIADKDHKVIFHEHSFAGLSPDIVSVEEMHMAFIWIRR